MKAISCHYCMMMHPQKRIRKNVTVCTHNFERAVSHKNSMKQTSYTSECRQCHWLERLCINK